MTDIDRALTILANATTERAWLRAAPILRGICHTQAGVACSRCTGQGTRPYGNSSGWRGGAGVSPCEDDVCDLCWGTGRSDHEGEDLRALTGRLDALAHRQGTEASSAWLAARLGVDISTVRKLIPPLADRLRKLRAMEFWSARLTERLADALTDMAEAVVAESATGGGATDREGRKVGP